MSQPTHDDFGPNTKKLWLIKQSILELYDNNAADSNIYWPEMGGCNIPNFAR